MAERGSDDRHGFSPGFGRRREGRDRGKPSRERRVRDKEWIPITKLGRLVKEGKITSLQQIDLESFPWIERQIFDHLLGDRLKDEAQTLKDYRQKLMSAYQPMHKELYSLQPSAFFVPNFLKAIGDNTEESFRSMLSEPSPGIYTFAMFQPSFCELLLDEVENFKNWVNSIKFKIMRPDTMYNYGVVLDDFGLEPMLNKLMEEFISPMARVFFPEVGGSTLDSHHGFVVEYGKDKDAELGFHVDDSEVTLNVCLGKDFLGGESFFGGICCDKHVNTEIQTEEVFDYSHVPGQAVLHRGRHRHGARPTTSGYRINLLLWCRSSIVREMKAEDCSSWCGGCHHEKKEGSGNQLLKAPSIIHQ